LSLKILGSTETHDSGIALPDDGVPVVKVPTERLQFFAY